MKVLGLCSLLLAGSLLAQDFQTLAQHAVQLQQASDFAGAETAYRHLLQLDPNQVATRVNLAIVLVNLAKYDQAIEQYQAAARLLPGDQRIAVNMALAYEKSGRVGEACQQFSIVHRAAPADDKVTMLLADCSGQLGQDARVVELLQPIAATHPDDLALSYMLGMALLHEHRLDEGQLYLDRILRNGDTAESRYLLATRMFESGDFPAAIEQFRKTLDLNPNLPHVNGFYGQALLNTGDPDAAAAAFRQELRQDANDFVANLGLAQILVVRKNFGDAVPPASRAHAMRADSAAANLVLAQALAGMRTWATAATYAERAAALSPVSLEAHQTLAGIYTQMGKATLAARERQAAAGLQAKAEAGEPGPKVNDLAPDFHLPRADGTEFVTLSSYRGKSPLVVVFGSYTCPNFRDAAASLKHMQTLFGARIPFLLIYIREAHSNADWRSTRNHEVGQMLPPAASIGEKREHAQMCSRQLHLPFPAVVDGMDNAVESAYSAWPSRAFIISTDGRVVYRTGLTELEFHPEQMEALLQNLANAKELSARK